MTVMNQESRLAEDAGHERSNLGGNFPSNNIRNRLKLYIIRQNRISVFQTTEMKLPTFSTGNTLS